MRSWEGKKEGMRSLIIISAAKRRQRRLRRRMGKKETIKRRWQSETRFSWNDFFGTISYFLRKSWVEDLFLCRRQKRAVVVVCTKWRCIVFRHLVFLLMAYSFVPICPTDILSYPYFFRLGTLIPPNGRECGSAPQLGQAWLSLGPYVLTPVVRYRIPTWIFVVTGVRSAWARTNRVNIAGSSSNVFSNAVDFT